MTATPAAVHVATDETGVTAGAARARALASLVSRSGAVVVLVILMIIGAIFDKGFIHLDNLRNIAFSASTIGIITVGMTFVIISGGIDLSVGSVFALGVLSSAFMSEYGSFWTIVVPLLVCAAAGLVQGVVIAWLRLPPFIVTFAGLTAVRGIVYYITDEGNLVPKVPGHKSFETLGQGKLFTLGWPVWITLILFAVGWWLLNRTAFGQAVQTIGGSDTAAELMGLPVKRVKTLVYVISGLCAGLAGITLWWVISNLVTQGLRFNPQENLVVSGGFLLVVVILQTFLSRRAAAVEGH